MIEILPPSDKFYVSERIGEKSSHIRPRSVSLKLALIFVSFDVFVSSQVYNDSCVFSVSGIFTFSSVSVSSLFNPLVGERMLTYHSNSQVQHNDSQ